MTHQNTWDEEVIPRYVTTKQAYGKLTRLISGKSAEFSP
jgi:hypothetical protein